MYIYSKIETLSSVHEKGKDAPFLNSNAPLKVSFTVSEMQTMIAGNNDSSSGLAVVHEDGSLQGGRKHRHNEMDLWLN